MGYRAVSKWAAFVLFGIGSVAPSRTSLAQGAPDVVWMAGGHRDGVRCVAIAPNGRIGASAGGFYPEPDSVIKIWDLEHRTLVRTLPGHESGVSAIAFSPDGSLLASCSGGLFNDADRTIRLWDVVTGTRLLQLNAGARNLAFSPDGRLLASAGGYTDPSVMIWSLPESRLLRKLPTQGSTVAFSPDGQTLAADGGGATLTLWRVADGTRWKDLDNQIFANPGSVAFSADGTHVALARDDYDISVWHIATGTLVRMFLGCTSNALFTADGKGIVFGAPDPQTGYLVRVCGLADGETLRQFGRGLNPVRALARSPQGETLIGDEGGIIRLKPAPDDQEETLLSTQFGRINCLAVSPDGTLLASADSSGIVCLRRTDTGSVTLSYTAHDLTSGLAFSPDGSMLATIGLEDGENVVRLWKTADGTLIGILMQSEGQAMEGGHLAFSPDGTLLAAAGGAPDTSVRLWQIPSGTLRGTLTEHSAPVAALAFSPDGSVLATAGSWRDNRVCFWQVTTGTLLSALSVHQDTVSAVAFSPDGSTFASASWDGTLRLAPAADPTQGRVLLGHTAPINAMAFSPSGTRLLTGSDDGTLRFWRVVDGEPLQYYDQETGMAVTAIAFDRQASRFVYGRADAVLVSAKLPWQE